MGVVQVVQKEPCGSIQGGGTIQGGGNEKDPLLGGNVYELMRRKKWKNIAWWACSLSILWNTAEGACAVYFGVQAQQIALLVFGSQSLIEILAAALVLYRFNLDNRPAAAGGAAQVGNIERTGSRVVGGCLVALSLYAVAQAIFNIVHHIGPDSTTWGIIIAAISALAMLLCWVVKDKAAKILQSPVLASDAKCSQMCMSLGLLVVVSSLLFLFSTDLWWVDSVCTIFLALKFMKDGVLVVKASFKADFEGGCGCCS